jgi:phage-related protein
VELGKAVIAIEAIDYTKDVFASLQANLSQISGVIGEIGPGFDSLGRVLQGFAAGGVVGAGIAGFGELVGFLKDSVDAAAESQKVWADLASAVERTGVNFAQVKGDLEAVATSLSHISTFDDEAIVSAMKNLMTYGMDYKTAMEAVAVAVDTAAAKGMDLQSATTAIGKAFNENYGALERLGVVLDDNVKKTGSFKDVLAALNEQFGGAAAAQVDTYAGKLQQMQNEWQNLQETIGAALLPALTDFMKYLNEVITAISPAIQEVLDALGELGRALGLNDEQMKAIGDFIKNFLVVELTGLAELIRLVADAITGWKMIFQDVATVIGPPIQTAIDLIQKLIDVLVQAKQKWDDFFSGLGAVKEKTSSLLDDISSKVSEAASKLSSVFTGGGGETAAPTPTPTPVAETPPPTPAHQGATPYFLREEGMWPFKKKIYQCPVCGYTGSENDVKKHIEQMVAKGMAEGGVVERPMFTLLGERGAEAVIPLRKLPELAATQINMTNNFTFTGPISSDVNIHEIAEMVSRAIAEKLAMKYRARRMMYA